MAQNFCRVPPRFAWSAMDLKFDRSAVDVDIRTTEQQRGVLWAWGHQMWRHKRGAVLEHDMERSIPRWNFRRKACPRPLQMDSWLVPHGLPDDAPN